MKKRQIIFIYLFILAIFEVTLLNNFKVFSTKPQLIVPVLVILSLSDMSMKWLIFFIFFYAFILESFSTYAIAYQPIMIVLLAVACKKYLHKFNLENQAVVLGILYLLAFLFNVFKCALLSLAFSLKSIFFSCLYTTLAYPFLSRLFNPLLGKDEN